MTDLLHAAQPWVDIWGTSLWRASYQGAIVLTIAWAIARWCTFLSPRVVCWIWRLACFKLLVALVWLHPLAIHVLPAQAGNAANGSTPTANAAVPSALQRSATSEIVPRRPSEALHAPARQTDLAPLSESTAEKTRIAAGFLLFFVWLAWVFYRIALTAKQWISVRRICRSAEPATSVALHRACAEQADRLGIRRLPELRLSPQGAGPMLAGIWRPTIVLPDGAETTFDDAELRLILGHELAHLKRHDLVWNWLPTVVSWIFCFHPLVWVMTRRWIEAQEAACDELVLQRGAAAPAEYGRLLVKLAQRWPLEPRGLAAAGVLGSYRNLERRISQMARLKPYSLRRLAIAGVILSLVAALGIIPWRLAAAQETSNQQEQTQATGSQQLYRDTSSLLGLPGLSFSEPIAAGKLPVRSAEEIQLLEESVTNARRVHAKVDVLFWQGARGGEAEKHAATAYALARARARLAWAKGDASATVAQLEEAVGFANYGLEAVQAAYEAETVTLDLLLDATENKTSAKLLLYHVREALKKLGHDVKPPAREKRTQKSRLPNDEQASP